jgi:hypothetical protein
MYAYALGAVSFWSILCLIAVTIGGSVIVVLPGSSMLDLENYRSQSTSLGYLYVQKCSHNGGKYK